MNLPMRVIAVLIALIVALTCTVMVVRWVNAPPKPGEVRALVKKGDLAAVERVLQRGFDVDDGIENLLHAAVDAGNLAMVKLLLRHNANPNMNTFPSGSVLWSAVGENQVEIVKVLLDAGADPDYRFPMPSGSVSLLYQAKLSAPSAENSELYSLIRSRATVDTTQRDEQTVRKPERSASAVADCVDLWTYADAMGHSFFEKAQIVDSARKQGACK